MVVVEVARVVVLGGACVTEVVVVRGGSSGPAVVVVEVVVVAKVVVVAGDGSSGPTVVVAEVVVVVVAVAPVVPVACVVVALPSAEHPAVLLTSATTASDHAPPASWRATQKKAPPLQANAPPSLSLRSEVTCAAWTALMLEPVPPQSDIQWPKTTCADNCGSITRSRPV